MHLRKEKLGKQDLFQFCFSVNTRNNDQKQKSTGASASRMLGRSASSFPTELFCGLPRRSCRPLEQIDNVGQNDQAYDGKEHQNENIQHYGVLARGVLWIPEKREL